MASTSAMVAGLDVYTIDGDKIGTVKETRGSYFKVDAKMQPDFWLDAAMVQPPMAGDRVTMTFDKDHLGDYKRKVKDDGTVE